MTRRKQADRTAATRSALVAAGRRLFAEHGFAGVGTEAIVAEAAVSRGTLFHHFADKTELFAGVIEAVEAGTSPTRSPRAHWPATTPSPSRRR